MAKGKRCVHPANAQPVTRLAPLNQHVPGRAVLDHEIQGAMLGGMITAVVRLDAWKRGAVQASGPAWPDLATWRCPPAGRQ